MWVHGCSTENSAFLTVKCDQLSPTNVMWAEVMCAILNLALKITVVLQSTSSSSKLGDGQNIFSPQVDTTCRGWQNCLQAQHSLATTRLLHEEEK